MKRLYNPGANESIIVSLEPLDHRYVYGGFPKLLDIVAYPLFAAKQLTSNDAN